MRDGRQLREQTAQHTLLKRRASADHYALMQEPITDEEEVPDSYYPQRMPTSTRRYVDTRGNQVIQQGNRRIVIHEEPPPKMLRGHGWLYLFLGIVVMLLLWIGIQLLSTWWTNHQLDASYGFPRTYQTDAVIYPGDSTDHPSHYIFLNLNGTVEIIELPHGDSARARIYKGPTLFSNDAALIPVTGEFKQVDSKEEMIVHIQDQRIIYINDGTQFKPQA